MIKAVIFDMDGLLVDSEPLWQQAEIKVFGKLGIKITPEMCEPLQGVKLDEAIQYWYDYQPWQDKNFDVVFDEIIDEMKILLKDAKIMQGVFDVINFYHSKNIPMAIASSSYMSLIEIVVEKLNISEKINVLHSAEFEKFGKPSPDIFLTTAKKLNVEPENCLVFEDSVNGVKAGKTAGMKVVAVPYPENFNNKEFDIADWKVPTINKFLTLQKYNI